MSKPYLYSLEYYVSLGCNNACVGCSHGAPIHSGTIDLETFKRDMTMAAKIMSIHRFALSGGEPLLNSNLVEMIKFSRRCGLALEVMVLTNGVLLDKMSGAFWRNLDVLRISAYGNQLTPGQLQQYETQAKLHGAEFMMMRLEKFYKPLTALPRDKESTEQTFKACKFFHKCSAIYKGRYYPCSQAFFIPELMGVDPNVDSLALEGLTSERLQEFIDQKEPLVSCQRCSYTEEIPWVQTTRDRWVEDSTCAVS